MSSAGSAGLPWAGAAGVMICVARSDAMTADWRGFVALLCGLLDESRDVEFGVLERPTEITRRR